MDPYPCCPPLANVRRMDAQQHSLLDLGGAAVSAGLLVLIAPDVPVVRLAEALAAAGLVVRQDGARLVIRPATRGYRAAPELARLLNRLSVGGRDARR